MSVSIVVVPAALAFGGPLISILTGAFVLGSVGTQITNALAESSEFFNERNQSQNDFAQDIPQVHKVECEDLNIIEAQNLIEKQFQTPFTDKEILIKTLEEHGCSNFTEKDNKISCTCQNFSFDFTKPSSEAAYNVIIHCREHDNAEAKIKEIDSEYTMNVQEESYLNIISKLKENNMEIESEEILEDNTVVLTVNVE